jgi:hypothetical protein
MEGQRLELQKQLESLDRQLALQKEKQRSLTVTSPTNGQVTTWQVKELLIHRPVQRGQVLMSVADPTGDWELEIHMAENRMGHIGNAIKELGADRDVQYILATAPGVTLHGKVKEVSKIGENEGEEGNKVLIKVAINKNDIPQLRAGATVTAKIHAGTASLGYTWFHDLVGWFQSKIWFRL